MATSSDDYYTTQSLLGSFRVAELKQLMKCLNISATGRKKDLQLRAEQLLQSGAPQVHSHVKEIYERSFGRRNVPPKTTPPKPPMTSSTASAPPPFIVKHPDVKFKSHPFYQVIDTIMRPTLLVTQSSGYSKDKIMITQFHLTPQQIQQVFISETTPGNFQTQIILRLCRRETSCEQEDYCPTECRLSINKNHCSIPGYNFGLSSRPDYKYHMKPVNITSFIHTSAAQANTVTVSWRDDILNPQGYCITIQLARSLSPSDLLQTLKGKGVKSPDISLALVKDKLSVEADSEISATSLRVSLICPLGKVKMSYPCRSISCNHLQCFEASTYLQLNEKKPKWVCPVCDRKAPFLDLIIDGLMKDICSRCTETEIEFSRDGTWKPITRESKASVTLSCNQSLVIISDSPKHASITKAEPVVIDLTLDSDDENDSIREPKSDETVKDGPSSPSILRAPPSFSLSPASSPSSGFSASPPPPPHLPIISSSSGFSRRPVISGGFPSIGRGVVSSSTSTGTHLPVILDSRTRPFSLDHTHRLGGSIVPSSGLALFLNPTSSLEPTSLHHDSTAGGTIRSLSGSRIVFPLPTEHRQKRSLESDSSDSDDDRFTNLFSSERRIKKRRRERHSRILADSSGSDLEIIRNTN